MKKDLEFNVSRRESRFGQKRNIEYNGHVRTLTYILEYEGVIRNALGTTYTYVIIKLSFMHFLNRKHTISVTVNFGFFMLTLVLH